MTRYEFTINSLDENAVTSVRSGDIDFPDAFKGDNVGENVDIIMCHHALFSGTHTMSRLNKVTETTQIYKNATKDFPDGNFPESSSGMFS